MSRLRVATLTVGALAGVALLTTVTCFVVATFGPAGPAVELVYAGLAAALFGIGCLIGAAVLIVLAAWADR